MLEKDPIDELINDLHEGLVVELEGGRQVFIQGELTNITDLLRIYQAKTPNPGR